MRQMKRAFSPNQLYGMRKETIPFEGAWADAFGTPEACGTWFIWGQSGNGKSSFLVQLAKALCLAMGNVIYDSLEEGFALSFRDQLRRHKMQEVNSRIKVVQEDMETLKARLRKRKIPRVVIIDSIQYTGLSFGDYLAMTAEFPRHLFIFSCQARGNKPDGRTATRVMYDSMLKIWIEGYRAVSKGRFIGPVGYYDIWPEKSAVYWGDGQDQPAELSGAQSDQCPTTDY